MSEPEPSPPPAAPGKPGPEPAAELPAPLQGEEVGAALGAVRCQVCGDLLAAPSGCPACRDELKGEAPQLVRPRGLAPFEVLRGMLYLPRGALHLLRNPRLWKLAAVPLLINFGVVLLALGLSWFFVVPYIEGVTGEEALKDWTGWWVPLSYAVWFLGKAFEVLAVVFLPLIASWLLVAFPLGIVYKALFIPFMERLGAATDRSLLVGDQERLQFQTSQLSILWGIVDAVVLGLLQGLVFLILLPMNFVPLLGSIVWLLLPPAIFASMDFSDIHLVRRGYGTKEKMKLWWEHQWRFLGYGLSFCFFLTLPVLNAFAIPAATVGGALLYLELDRK